MDWHKYDRYTQYKKAPFVADHSFAHFMISMEDVMCMAQTVETVAYLYGIGSCYVGSVCNFIQPISQALKLPKGVFPVVLLSLGYPKKVPQNRVTKLKRDMIFCEESYTPYTDEEICQAFDEKYAGKKLPLPKNNPASAQQMLDTFYQCALTTYSKEEADAILAEIRENGSFNETQRRFGLHYEAAGILELGKQMQQELVAQGIDPFTQKKQ
jgi:FMN reductase [NAD(P)H]